MFKMLCEIEDNLIAQRASLVLFPAKRKGVQTILDDVREMIIRDLVRGLR